MCCSRVWPSAREPATADESRSHLQVKNVSWNPDTGDE
jgi:hypothetical protein